jgi:hypothetical protein
MARGTRLAAFAVGKNAKRELSFFLTAARVAGQSPLGSKAASPPAESETVLEGDSSQTIEKRYIAHSMSRAREIYFSKAAWAAAKRATGTRFGEQLT